MHKLGGKLREKTSEKAGMRMESLGQEPGKMTLLAEVVAGEQGRSCRKMLSGCFVGSFFQKKH